MREDRFRLALVCLLAVFVATQSGFKGAVGSAYDAVVRGTTDVAYAVRSAVSPKVEEGPAPAPPMPSTADIRAGVTSYLGVATPQAPRASANLDCKLRRLTEKDGAEFCDRYFPAR